MGEFEMMLGRALDTAQAAHKRLSRLEQEVKDLRVLALAVATVDGKVNCICEDVAEMKLKIAQAAARPAKWWDKLTAAALGAFASGVTAAILAQILR